MQTEMILEIQVSRPEFIVMANIHTSWLFDSNSQTLLMDWALGYVNSGYEVAGVVDIFSDKETVYKWGEQAKGYFPRSNHYLLIYKKRS